jgi:hypothetical protein
MGFALEPFAFADLSVIMGPVLDTFAISLDVEGTSYEESGWRVHSFLLSLFRVLAKLYCFASLVVTPQGYNAGGHSCAQPTSSHRTSHRLPTSFPTAEKKER